MTAPAGPAPGPTAAAAREASPAARVERARRLLSLPLVRRASSLRDGQHPSVLQGHGQDFDDLVLYTPGDDVGDIDWKSTARGGVPVIKRYQRDAAAPVVIALDSGRTMAATAASGEAKSEVARHVAEIAGVLALDRGDPVGLVAGDSERLVRVPARTGRLHLELVLRRMDRTLDVTGPAPDLDRVLHRVHVTARTPGLVVLVTDAGSLTPYRREALSRLVAARHTVVAMVVADADPLDPAAPGTTDVLDGWQVPAVLTGRQDVRAAVHQRRVWQSGVREGMLRRLGGTHTVVGGTDEAVTALAQTLDRRRRGAR